MNRLLLFGLCIFLVVGSVLAFTYSQIGHTNSYLIGFNDGRNGTAYNVSYDRKANLLNVHVVMSDGGGMTMQELTEVHAWADAQNGIVGKASTATFNIN